MAESMDYNEDTSDEGTLVKYNNPVLVIKNPEKPSDTVAIKVYFVFGVCLKIQ